MIAPPYLVSYAITRKCNLKCKHCYSDAADSPGPDELSAIEAKGLLDDLAKLGIRLLIFDGGEPLCREDFFEIARYASEKGMRTVVGTNGILIDAEMANRMKRAGIQAVQISIDGAKPATHDSFRGEDGAFHKAMQGVEACKKAGLPFQLGMVIRRRSLPEISDMLRLAVESGA
jgi:MoaA/NifB/PqqE/SkfB family radical SAM enzyme